MKARYRSFILLFSTPKEREEKRIVAHSVFLLVPLPIPVFLSFESRSVMRVVLFPLPGFGLHGPDYASLIASSGVDSHVAFDVWPRTVEAVTAIGPPDSPSFNAWKAAKVKESLPCCMS